MLIIGYLARSMYLLTRDTPYVTSRPHLIHGNTVIFMDAVVAGGEGKGRKGGGGGERGRKVLLSS